jgi:hypothetical protein
LPLSNKHSNDGTENTELAPARKQQKPKPSLSIHNTSIQRIRYSIRRPPRKGNSSTWPSDWDQSVHIIHSEAGSQTKQSNIHDPSSPLEAGLGIASEGSVMVRCCLAVYDSYLRWIWLGRWVLPLRGRVTVKSFVRRNSRRCCGG